MMLASTLLYFFLPLLAVVFLYTRFTVVFLIPTFFFILFTLILARIGLALQRNKMQRCAVACSRGGQCQAERFGTLESLNHCLNIPSYIIYISRGGQCQAKRFGTPESLNQDISYIYI